MAKEIKPIELFIKYEKMQDWQKLEFMQFVADAINHAQGHKLEVNNPIKKDNLFIEQRNNFINTIKK